MPSFSQNSKIKLDTCDVLIMHLFYKIVENYDCTIISGHRTPEEQYKIFMLGRKIVNGKYAIVNKDQVRTYVDGYLHMSDHNYYPSKAVDVIPYPIDWEDIQRIKEFAAYVKGFAANLGIPILWGGDWQKFKDYVHWYLK